MNETFLKLLPLVKLVAKFSQSLSIAAFCLYEKTRCKHFEVEFFSKMILARSLRSSFNSLIHSALLRNAATPRKVLAPFSFGHLIDHCSFFLSLVFFSLVLFFTSHKFQRRRNGTTAFCRKNTIPVSL